jgi:basic membrane protein A
MKKLLTSVLTTALLIGGLTTLSGCGEKTVELALVTDVGDIDDESFNQSSWEALKDYAEANNKSYDYYRPTEDSTDARVKAIKQAITKGAKVVVCPGYLFEEAIYNVQDQYPEVNFLLLDGEPHTADYSTYKTSPNTANVLFQEHVSGYLAGYAAVKDGYTKLGFCGGMAVPAVQRFGSGFVQGVDAAASEMNVQVSVNYYYAGAFAATDDATAKMKEWYQTGTEVVFACGGKVYQSVAEGVKEKADGKWIGVDVDQVSVDPERIITSATKGLRESVTSALELHYASKWAEIGGKTANLGLGSTFGSLEARNYVGLPTSDRSWKFKTFTKTEYEALVAKLAAGTIVVSGDVAAAPTVSAKTTVNYISGFAG